MNRRNFQPITLEMDEDIDSYLAFSSSPVMTLVSINGVNIENIDIELLNPCVWLNDNLINTVLFLITRDSPPSFAFSTYFAEMLRIQGYSDTVRRQTRPIDRRDEGELFSQKMVFIPVNPGRNHWTLVAINMLEKTITYYDSLGGRDQVMLKIQIEQFLIIYIYSPF